MRSAVRSGAAGRTSKASGLSIRRNETRIGWTRLGDEAGAVAFISGSPRVADSMNGSQSNGIAIILTNT